MTKPFHVDLLEVNQVEHHDANREHLSAYISGLAQTAANPETTAMGITTTTLSGGTLITTSSMLFSEEMSSVSNISWRHHHTNEANYVMQRMSDQFRPNLSMESGSGDIAVDVGTDTIMLYDSMNGTIQPDTDEMDESNDD